MHAILGVVLLPHADDLILCTSAATQPRPQHALGSGERRHSTDRAGLGGGGALRRRRCCPQLELAAWTFG